MISIKQFLQLNHSVVNVWFKPENNNVLKISLFITLFGTAFYGITIGMWRGIHQAMYVSLKFPLLIILTTALNSLINWFISLMVGANFSFIRTLKYQFVSYAIASIILLSFTPITLYFLWNTPSIHESGAIGNSVITLTHVLVIAIAGIIANLKLFNLLKLHLDNKGIAKSVLAAWLIGNMVLGCQISWILRPFIGSPNLEIQFLRKNPLEGNFYIDVYNKIKTITSNEGEVDNE